MLQANCAMAACQASDFVYGMQVRGRVLYAASLLEISAKPIQRHMLCAEDLGSDCACASSARSNARHNTTHTVLVVVRSNAAMQP